MDQIFPNLMRKHSNQILFSATNLTSFIECHLKATLDLSTFDGKIPNIEENSYIKLLKNKGLAHEAHYLQSLKASGFRVIEISTKDNLENRVKLTLEAMKEGPDYIAQAALLHDHWHGFADLLKRVERPSQLGSFSYEAVDVKLSKHPEPFHIIQLCVYSDLLEQCQGNRPLFFSVILGNNEEKSFSFNDFAYYYATVKEQFETFAFSFPSTSVPLPCSFCSRCQWQDQCDQQLNKEDHLSQVANITAPQIKKLEESGILTVEKLALLNDDVHVSGFSEETLSRLKSQSRLQYAKRITGKDEFKLLPAKEGKGFARLPKSDPNDLFFDMEGDPLYFPDGLEYLFGIYYLSEAIPIFKPFWAHDKEEEKRAFQEAIDFITDHLTKHPDAHIYHYNHYEETAIKRLASRYGTREAEVDNILRKRKLVDLFKVVREAIQISEPRYSIKNLEVFYMEKRDSDVATAKESIVVYNQWRSSQDGTLLEQIQEYNEDDCRSTYLLRQWLLKLRPPKPKWFELENANTADENEQKSNEKEKKREEYEEALLKDATPQDQSFRELLVDLLGFHRREEKPVWWSLFDRQDKGHNELIDDSECLAGLTLSSEIQPFKEKRSTVFTFSFPSQEHKLSVDDDWSLSSSIKRLGKIHSLNNESQIVSLKTTQISLPNSCSITLYPSVSNGPLKEALYRFADGIIAQTNRYSALTAFLKRESPNIKDHQPDMPIACAGDSIIDSAIQTISGLQNSYLFIQGPPGSGKTYTSSQIIVDLIRSGKRVAVSSNSHKAINNLLSGIEKAAKEKGILFRGQKKSSSDESEFEGEIIKNFSNNEEIDFTSDLIAGTAWLFAREECDQKFDYLFVDEAGQVSLANFVAMGMCARNIILIGDQMQLSQPLKGTHPGSSGMSTLEYLLQDKAIIQPERGIFLGTTWRMHENICRFISDAVYDGQLKPELNNQLQSLILSSDAHPALIENGISFIPAQHQGCGQKSEEEGMIIRDLYSSLIKQSYRDRNGIVKSMTSENILVVAPYNMQVNYLESILPEEARVGTVDKFQGQEAEVVLVSMTTSDAENLPRDLEFLYSKNRLNVAISRARILAVVIANPLLLEIHCSHIEQMRLVNTLCWVEEYANELHTVKYHL